MSAPSSPLSSTINIEQLLLECANDVAPQHNADNLTTAARARLLQRLFAELDPLRPDAPLELAQIFERSLAFDVKLSPSGECTLASSSKRKSSGAYYTPNQIVEHLVATCFERLGGELTSATVLDPACGAGVFLVHILRELLKRTPGKQPNSVAARIEFIQRHIFGLDLDPLAAEATRRALVLAAGSNDERWVKALESNVRCGDALVDDATVSEHAFDWKREFPAIFEGDEPGFDLVIGNPPWVSYSGRQAEALPTSQMVNLKEKYNTCGWMASHSLFVERAFRDLSRRMVAFVLPGQVGHLAGYAGLRDLVEPALVESRQWGEDVFEDATTPTMTLITDRVQVHHKEHPTTLLTKRKGSSTAEINAAFIAKIMRRAESLGDLVADVGVHTGNCSKKLIHKEPGKGRVPVLEGRQIQEYECAQPAKWLDLNYEAGKGEYFTLREEGRYEDAAFLIRQTAAYPIVGPRRGATYFRNSLLALYEPDDDRDIHYIVGVLNSRLMRWIYKQQVADAGQKAFPQVKIAALRNLPILYPQEPKVHEEIVSDVLYLLEHTQKDDAFWSRLARIERAVRATYGVDDDQSRRIDAELALF